MAVGRISGQQSFCLKKVLSSGACWKIRNMVMTTFWFAKTIINMVFMRAEMTIATSKSWKCYDSRHGKEAFTQHHYTRAHKSCATRTVIKRLNSVAVLDPPCNLDLAPCDYHLMAWLKHDLFENHYCLKKSQLL